jgi:dTDP-4-amino-4,6-dideoxygalactose transaminase
MIAELDETLVNEHEISSRILNLPLHQDIESDQLDEMLEILIEMVESHKRRSIII